MKFRSLLWGLVVYGVPMTWWKARVHKLWEFWTLDRCLPLHEALHGRHLERKPEESCEVRGEREG